MSFYLSFAILLFFWYPLTIHSFLFLFLWDSSSLLLSLFSLQCNNAQKGHFIWRCLSIKLSFPAFFFLYAFKHYSTTTLECNNTEKKIDEIRNCLFAGSSLHKFLSVTIKIHHLCVGLSEVGRWPFCCVSNSLFWLVFFLE